jgi:carbamoyl-phosphate synthase large subunit
MKSVGEVMALGRSASPRPPKGCAHDQHRRLGLVGPPHEFTDPAAEIGQATDHRLYALYDFLKAGGTTADAHERTGIDPWFLDQLQRIARLEHKLTTAPLKSDLLRDAKKNGFADKTIAKLTGSTENEVRTLRLSHG